MNTLALKSDPPNYSVAGECSPGALVIRGGPLSQIINLPAFLFKKSIGNVGDALTAWGFMGALWGRHMSAFPISEAASVQFPMVRHATEVGWTPISPKEAPQKRGDEAGMLFHGELQTALRQFNPWMTGDAIRAAIEKLEALPPTIEGNREMLAWMRGERQWYDENENRQRHVHLVDFDNPSANTFHVTWEWKIKPPARKGNRADVMFVVNGVPVTIVEHKNPTGADAIEQGVTQLRRYESETPELMVAPQLFNVTHLFEYWYGVTWNVSQRFMARWEEQQDENYRFAVQSFFEPPNLLRTPRDLVLFYVWGIWPPQSMLRQIQR